MPAVTTPAEVCNLALGLVGQRQFIDDLNEASTEAECCARFYPHVRTQLLSMRDWRFARKRAVLAESLEEREGWGYAYTAPADLLVARRIWEGVNRPGRGEEIPFALELNDAATGHLILTNQGEASLLYTVDLTTVTLWKPLFVEAVAAELAVRLAGALPVKPQLIPLLRQGAHQALLTARAGDVNEAVEEEEPDSEFIRVRG